MEEYWKFLLSSVSQPVWYLMLLHCLLLYLLCGLVLYRMAVNKWRKNVSKAQNNVTVSVHELVDIVKESSRDANNCKMALVESYEMLLSKLERLDEMSKDELEGFKNDLKGSVSIFKKVH